MDSLLVNASSTVCRLSTHSKYQMSKKLLLNKAPSSKQFVYAEKSSIRKESIENNNWSIFLLFCCWRMLLYEFLLHKTHFRAVFLSISLNLFIKIAIYKIMKLSLLGPLNDLNFDRVKISIYFPTVSIKKKRNGT